MPDITGRDHYLITQALAIAIGAIDALPNSARPLSDQNDMKKLLDHMVENDRDLQNVVDDARRKINGLGSYDSR